jgi:hypothetical protein
MIYFERNSNSPSEVPTFLPIYPTESGFIEHLENFSITTWLMSVLDNNKDLMKFLMNPGKTWIPRFEKDALDGMTK